ncbi:DegV family EDD domain-containing protein [Pseudothauera nasutitermitis]|uniref:DegV family EDD domain-containing protein n=1 Tax=Pseudothauera nasutitermitis TaxID=2565930 RepID=A0A4S4AWD7_9RHOO|nr:DegV family protein [Pseudothauera nasutitermitis]THF62918.1 DegV family EDD domain-containing protein [Pseudothauera nasutitermitis]
MEIGLVVDAACDLPPAFLAEQGVEVLPIGIRLGERQMEDVRDPERTAAFYRERLDRRTELHAQSRPLEPAEIEAVVLERWATRYDHLVCMTITASRSPIYAHATRAALTVGTRAREVRRAAGLPLRWGATVVNSRSMFAGQGVLAWEAARLRAAGSGLGELEQRLLGLAEHIHAYLVADDLYFILHRAARKGERSVNWASYALGNLLDVKPILHCHRDSTEPVAKARGFEAGARRLFDNVLAQCTAGLEVPCVCLSYAGDLARLERLEGYAGFRAALQTQGVALLVSQMSKTGAINVGIGSLCVAFAAARHRFS